MIEIKQNNLPVGLHFQILNLDTKPMDLTDKTVNFVLANSSKTILINRQCVVSNAINGEIEFYFLDGELTELGEMQAELEIKYSDGTSEVFPNEGYIPINVIDKISDGTETIIIVDGGVF